MSKSKGTLFLHIGDHKTGSSTLQKWSAKNAKLLRERHNIFYPRALRKGAGQHLLGFALYNEMESNNGLDKNHLDVNISSEEAVKQLKLKMLLNRGDVLISTESLMNLDEQAIEKLAKYLKPFNTKVIIYLRPLHQRVQSGYKHIVMQHKSPLNILDAHMLHMKDDDQYGLNNIGNRLKKIEYYRKAFGENAVLVLPYVRNELKDGDTVSDFFSHNRPDVYADLGNMQRISNEMVSPPSHEVEIVRRLNQHGFFKRMSHDRHIELLKMRPFLNGVAVPKNVSFYSREFVNKLEAMFGDIERKGAEMHFPKLASHFDLSKVDTTYLEDLVASERDKYEALLDNAVQEIMATKSQYEDKGPRRLFARG